MMKLLFPGRTSSLPPKDHGFLTPQRQVPFPRLPLADSNTSSLTWVIFFFLGRALPSKQRSRDRKMEGLGPERSGEWMEMETKQYHPGRKGLGAPSGPDTLSQQVCISRCLASTEPPLSHSPNPALALPLWDSNIGLKEQKSPPTIPWPNPSS